MNLFVLYSLWTPVSPDDFYNPVYFTSSFNFLLFTPTETTILPVHDVHSNLFDELVTSLGSSVVTKTRIPLWHFIYNFRKFLISLNRPSVVYCSCSSLIHYIYFQNRYKTKVKTLCDLLLLDLNCYSPPYCIKSGMQELQTFFFVREELL